MTTRCPDIHAYSDANVSKNIEKQASANLKNFSKFNTKRNKQAGVYRKYIRVPQKGS